MHYSMNPSPDHLAEGMRIVAKPGYPYEGGPEILVVKSAGRGRPWQAADRRGNVFEGDYGRIELKSPTREGKLYVTWTLPLPETDDAEALRWASILSNGENDAPLLAHVSSVGDGMAKARLVSTSWDRFPAEMDGVEKAERYETRAAGHLKVTVGEIALSLEGLPEETAAGDLLCLHKWTNRVKDGAIVTQTFHSNRYFGKAKSSPAILASGVSEQDLPGLLPTRMAGEEDRATLGGFSRDVFATADVSDLFNEDAAAIARTEPDEALVLWFKDDRDQATCHVLGSTGYTFMVCDNVADQFYGADLEPGLWIMRGAKWWAHTSYEGEHDSGVEGDWEPATLQDFVSFGYDGPSLSNEIREVLSEYGTDLAGGDVTAEWIAKAEAACAAERATPAAAKA